MKHCNFLRLKYRFSGLKHFFIVILLGLGIPTSAFAQQPTKVKVFLMAGQSNMQGYAQQAQLNKILCAKQVVNLPNDPKECYASLDSEEERLFQTISDFYWNGSQYAYGYEEIHARLEAETIHNSNLMDERLLNPLDQVQVVNFKYTRSGGIRSNPSVWSGPLKPGFGHNSSNSFGPELVFGHYMAQHIEEDIVIVKLVEGGTSLHVQWRSPSMEARLGVAGEPSNYPLLAEHLNDVKNNLGNYINKYQGQDVEVEVAGFVWFQGWNDAVSAQFAPEYEQNLTDLLNDLRAELDLPHLPIVIGKTQNDGSNGVIVQQAQQAVGDNIGNAKSVTTNDLSNYYHFDSGSHLIIGERMGQKMTDLIGTPVPSPWVSEDIGSPAISGQATYHKEEQAFTIKAAGKDIWNTSDEFHYVHQSLQGDGEIIAKVNSITNTDLWAKAGVMIRETLDADAKQASMVISSGRASAFQRRIEVAATSTYNPGTRLIPAWLRLKRTGDTFTGFISQDGSDWEKVGEVTIPMQADVTIGLAVTSHNVDAICTAKFSNVSVIQELSLPWSNVDIGEVGVPGTAIQVNDKIIVTGSGDDIWGESDHFHFVYQPLIGDGQIVARVDEMAIQSNYPKGGIMIRESLDPASKHAMMMVTNGVQLTSFFQRRLQNDATTISTSEAGGGTPVWHKLIRTGNIFTGYRSDDGVTWELVGQDEIQMGQEVFVGLVATAGGIDKICTPVYSNVTVSTQNLVEGKSILHMPRLAGDHDRSDFNNTIQLSTSAEAENEPHIYTGLLGKKIRIKLASPFSSKSGTISFKTIPSTDAQTQQIFKSQSLSINQTGNKISVKLNDEELANQSILSTVSCNHIALRLTNQTAELYVNGEWVVSHNPTSFIIEDMEWGTYNGRVWDIQVFDGYVHNQNIQKLSEYCLTSVAVQNPPNPEFPNALCAAYVCLWGNNDQDLSEDKFQYYVHQQESAYETFTFKAGMYLHGNLENHIKSRRGRDLAMHQGIVQKFVNPWSFNNLHARQNANFWWHENFHSFQSFHPNSSYRGTKWILESTAEWGSDLRYPGVTSTLLGYYSLHPHLPIWTMQNSQVDDYAGWEFKGGHQYGAYVFFSYLTNFVTNPFFIGKLYNDGRAGSDPFRAIDELLEEEGHDLRTVFGDFAAHTTVWDYENGTGEYFADSERQSLDRMKSTKPDAETFDNKFTHVYTAEGTNGLMTSIPNELVPGAWAYNAYKVTNTSAGSYTINLRGEEINPNNTKLQARVVQESNGIFVLHEFPISQQVAFGNQEAQMTINTSAGDQLYLVVATTPEVYKGYDNHYRYEYAIKANSNTASRRINNFTTNSIAAGEPKIYPTKTDGLLSVDLGAYQSEPVEIRILDTAGKVLLTQKFVNTRQAEVHFDGPAGVYLLKIRSKNENKDFKFIKQ